VIDSTQRSGTQARHRRIQAAAETTMMQRGGLQLGTRGYAQQAGRYRAGGRTTMIRSASASFHQCAGHDVSMPASMSMALPQLWTVSRRAARSGRTSSTLADPLFSFADLQGANMHDAEALGVAPWRRSRAGRRRANEQVVILVGASDKCAPVSRPACGRSRRRRREPHPQRAEHLVWNRRWKALPGSRVWRSEWRKAHRKWRADC
jgi:hypothetical protein